MANDSLIHAVTGAFGYSGKYITRLLLSRGIGVRALTNSPDRNTEFQGKVQAFPLDFDDHEGLVASLNGCEVLYNTYWVRFNHRRFTQARAVENTYRLFAAAREAGVHRVVHVSITNPSADSPYEYFSSKAAMEKKLVDSGQSYAILRPAVLFGGADILINNIAWALRRFPIMGVFGRGDYRIQPIHVEDFARLAVEQGSLRDDVIINATGPECFTYRELLSTVAAIIGKKRLIVPVPRFLGWAVAWLVGRFVRDVVLTRQEIGALCDDLLWADSPPSGTTKLTEWACARRDTLGMTYANEMTRRIDRKQSYEKL